MKEKHFKIGDKVNIVIMGQCIDRCEVIDLFYGEHYGVRNEKGEIFDAYDGEMELIKE